MFGESCAMSQTPLVSVIIPCYKQAHFLPQTIESVLSQTYSPIEILVVDDGSPDNVAEVVQRYPQVQYIHQQNAGVSAARNNGIKHSKGEFLQFIDSDDLLLPTKIEKSIATFNADPELGVVYTDFVVCDSNLVPMHQFPWWHSHPETELLKHLLHLGAPGLPHTLLIRRHLMEEIGGFNTKLKGCADFLVWFTLALNEVKFKYIDEKLTLYRRHSSSMSHDTLHMDEDKIRAWQITRTLTFKRKIDLDPYYGLHIRTYANRLWRIGRAAEARHYYREAMRYNKDARTRLIILWLLTYFVRDRNRVPFLPKW
jgi:glycosyltransferase involved in cell wall biosynthesis